MDPFMSDQVDSLAQSSKVSAASLLQGVILSNSDINTLLQQVTNIGQHGPLALNEVETQTFISSSDFTSNINSTMRALYPLFANSNSLSLLLESLNQTLISQVKLLEKQVSILETRLENYAFLSSDNNSYSYSYLENFHDNSGRDSFTWGPSDRDGTIFNSGEEALVNASANTLMLSSNIINPYPITPQLINGNALGLTVSDTGLANSVTAISSAGWRAEYSVTKPITSKLPSFEKPGAQVVLDFILNQPASASQIEIIPFSDIPIEIVQIQISDSNNYEISGNLLTSSVSISSPTTFTLPSQAVAKFRVFINQPTYTRNPRYINTPIQQSNSLTNQPNLQSALLGGKPQQRRWNYGEFFKITNQFNSDFPTANLKRPKSYQTSQGIKLNDIFRNQKTRLGPYIAWSAPTAQEQVVNQLFLQNPGYYKNIFQSGIATANFNKNNHQSLNPIVNGPQPVAAMPAPIVSTNEGSFNYNYDIGLQYVAIGYQSVGDKGVFISKPLPSTGNIGQIRIKAVEENIVSNTGIDQGFLTSTEYSVSNISVPQNENDWIPIFPINLTNQFFVAAERFFINSSGSGFLRFSANRSQPIVMYKNGNIFNITPDNYIYDISNNIVLGLNLPNGTYTESDIFVVSYNTGKDFSTITFPSLNDLPITSIFDSNGAGESFPLTTGRNTINLSQLPYIDHMQVNASKYTTNLGMVPYQPITVILNNGTNAINITNYSSGQQANLGSFVSGYYYIQSGNTIMFNVPITSSFKVYYQYLISNVRVRVVERVNNITFASPTVSSFNVKAKLIQPNPVSSLGLS